MIWNGVPMLVHFRSQGSKCDIPMIAPNSLQLQENINTTNDDCYVSENLTLTDCSKSDTAEVITAVTKPTDGERDETLSKNLNDVEIKEHITTELSSLNREAASSEMVSNLNRESEECCSEDTRTVLLEGEVKEICSVGKLEKVKETKIVHVNQRHCVEFRKYTMLWFDPAIMRCDAERYYVQSICACMSISVEIIEKISVINMYVVIVFNISRNKYCSS